MYINISMCIYVFYTCAFGGDQKAAYEILVLVGPGREGGGCGESAESVYEGVSYSAQYT